MQTPLRASTYFAAALTVIALAAMPPQTRAQSGVQPPVASAKAPKPHVLLRNNGVLQGTATQIGTKVQIQRDDSSTLVLDRSEVLCWGDSLISLYQFKKDHRSESNFGRLVDDARWCLKHGLIQQAADDIRAARAINPSDTSANLLAQRIARRITESILSPKSDVAQTGIRTVSHETLLAPSMVRPQSGDDRVNKRNESVSENLDPTTLQQFVRHVQPVLLNRCVRCHDHRSENQFRLLAPVAGSRPSQRISKENLVATMEFVALDNPPVSEILKRMTDGHAGDRLHSPMRLSRNLAGIQQWLATARWNTDLSQQETGLQIVSQDDVEIEALATDAAVTLDPDTIAVQAPKAPTRNDGRHEKAGSQSKEKKIARLPPVENPFDPDLFNRRFHRD